MKGLNSFEYFKYYYYVFYICKCSTESLHGYIYIFFLGIIPVPDTVWGIVVIVIAIICIIVFVPLFCCLATYGTRSIVRSVTLTNPATPLLPTADCGETSGLLTSSDVISNCWPGTSYERSNSLSYGTSNKPESSSNTGTKSEACEPKGAKFL